MSIFARSSLVALALALSSLAASCVADDPLPSPNGEPPPPQTGTTVHMSFAARATSFYAAPFPSDDRRRADGTLDLSGFPNPKKIGLVDAGNKLLEAESDGFGLTSSIYFALNGPIDPSGLPDVHGSVADGASVALIDVDASSPERGKHWPVYAKFLADGGPFGAPNLLALLPYPGMTLRPKTRYAAIVTTTLHDKAGLPLAVNTTMSALASSAAPEGLAGDALDAYRGAVAELAAQGLDPKKIAGLAVFTTGAPADPIDKVVAAMLASPPKPEAPFHRTDLFDQYCVYASTIQMPEYQDGTPPYSSSGGGWVFDASGKPVLQRTEKANFVVTVPRAPMPDAGYPIVVFSRTGGGGDRPLVDRGVQAKTGGPALVPGTGPALYFAEAGWAGSSIDGPHGGLRNVTGGDEQFLIFNVKNPHALRDNIRQSAAELALEAHVLDGITIDLADCPGASSKDGKARFDPKTTAIMGHSMGATISPLSLAIEPRFRAALLSGAGGSWIENVIYKLEPVPTKGIAGILLGLTGAYQLNEWDPALNLFQWAGEAADPPVYGRRIREPTASGPRHVLMMQGIVDTYIPPPVANATSLSLGLDLGGQALDVSAPADKQYTPLGSLLDLVGRAEVALPASNLPSSGVTAIVTQHKDDGIENGHEVVFQTDGPKHEYRCFLQTLKSGTPRVPSPGKADDPCD